MPLTSLIEVRYDKEKQPGNVFVTRRMGLWPHLPTIQS